MQITATGLSKRYRRKVAVDDVTFTVQGGHVTGFLGPNGAGKSTTMRMLLGLDRPDEGQVLYDGRPLTSYPNPLQTVGSLLDAKAFNPRVSAALHLQALAASHGLGRARVDEVLALTGLADVAGKAVGGFSLGMSQRLGIATAILADPQVLILDEPINGLDPEGVRWVRDTVRAFAQQGRTVFLSSHLMSEMSQTADRVLVIGRGKILADQSMTDILDGAGGNPVRVRSPHLSHLLQVLVDDNVRARAVDNTTTVITGLDAETIGRAAAEHRIVLFELAPVQSSLEDAYLDLTADAVDYRTGALA